MSTFWWSRVRNACARAIPGASIILKRGDTFATIPYISAILPFLALFFGFIAGIAAHAALPVYIGAPLYLAALLIVATLSPFLGLLGFAGFIGGEIFLFLGMNLRQPSIFYPLAIISSWIFLAQLIFLNPLIARAISRPPKPLTWLHPFIAIATAFFLAELWSRLAMIVLRPLFLWQKREVDMQLIYFGETEWELFGLHGHMLAWMAALAMALSFVLPALIRFIQRRWPGTKLEFDTTPLPAFALQWRPTYWHGLIWRCVIFTLLMAGIFTQIWAAILFALALYGVSAMRALSSHWRRIRLWDRWMHDIPPLIRLALAYILAVFVCYGLAGFLRDALGWRTLESLAIMIVIAIAITLPLWPQNNRDDIPHPTPWVVRRITAFINKRRKAIGASLWGCIILSGGAAFAHHCSFKPGCECLTDDMALAQTAAAAVFLFSLTPQGGWLEAALGRDLVTGQALRNWERLIRLVPGSKGMRLAMAGIGRAGVKLPAKASILMNKAGMGVGGKQSRQHSPNRDLGYINPPADKKLPGFPEARQVKRKTSTQGGGKKRDRWVDKDRKILEWDYKKGTIEKYDKSGKIHLGEFDFKTGKKIGKALGKDRSIKK